MTSALKMIGAVGKLKVMSEAYGGHQCCSDGSCRTHMEPEEPQSLVGGGAVVGARPASTLSVPEGSAEVRREQMELRRSVAEASRV